MPEANCWNCGKTLPELPLPLSRHEFCPHCAEPVHCCRMCVHFAPRLAGQCREERAEPPVDKTAANFCDYFALGAAAREDVGGDRARARLDALFGGTAASADAGAAGSTDHDSREAAARARLDALFGTDDEGGNGP